MTPVPGHEYLARGYRFRVHFVKDGEVFLARFPAYNPEKREGTLIRAELAVWEKEMSDATEINR